ncbi:MAG: sulfite reductase, partial [Pseudomonadota bacterium]
MERIIDKDRLGDWIAALEGWRVFAPVWRDGIWSYQAISEGSENAVRLDHSNTIQPPKSFAFPQREVFFRFDQIKGEAPRLTPIPPEVSRCVVLGVRPCDGRALPRMDRVFAEPADPYYQTRREQLAYVGLAWNQPPSPHCFCQSVGGSPVSTEGLDILMTDLGERYWVVAVTETGTALMQMAGPLLAEPGPEDRAMAGRLRLASLAHPQRAIHQTASVPSQLKTRFHSPLWEELAQPCIGCGICTFL